MGFSGNLDKYVQIQMQPSKREYFDWMLVVSSNAALNKKNIIYIMRCVKNDNRSNLVSAKCDDTQF